MNSLVRLLLVYFMFSLTYMYSYTTYSLSYHVDSLSQLCPPSSLSKSSSSYDIHSSNGPRSWYKLSRCCNGRRQSPVHLKSTTALCNQRYSFQYKQSRSTTVQANIYDNGQSVSVTFPRESRLSLVNVPRRAGDTFILGELHYHAGYMGGMGSEHLVDNKGYDGELHLVHYNRRYGGMDEATTKSDGLVVIAIFIKSAKTSPNSELRKFVELVSCLNGKEEKTPITIQPLNLLPRSKEFYVYEGSQTAPPCSESVMWIIMRDPIELTTAEINTLRNLRHKDGSILSTFTNIRPIQELNYRLVETNFPCTKGFDSYIMQYY